MFSSSTNTNSFSTTTLSLKNMSPFPQYYFPSLSSSSSSPPLNNYNNNLSQQPPSNHDDHILFHQTNQYDPTFLFPNNNNVPGITQINSGPSNTSIIIGNSCASNRTSGTIMASFYSNQDHDQVSRINISSNNINHLSALSPKKKPASKKDRHSKIYTAQGLRDRRVRLSIDIAREFFDLHDTLGFDKASKTLEWLLRKSNKAIVELSRGSKTISSATNCNSEIDQVNEDFDQTLEQGTGANPEHKSKASALRLLLAKESRAKARARARARTREKNHNSSSQILGQFMDANYQIVRECGSDDRHPIAFRQDRDQSDAVTSTIKKISGGYQKLKFPNWIINSSTTSENQQLQGFRTIPVGETYNNNVMSLLPQSWDINCTVSPPSSFSLRT